MTKNKNKDNEAQSLDKRSYMIHPSMGWRRKESTNLQSTKKYNEEMSYLNRKHLSLSNYKSISFPSSPYKDGRRSLICG